MSKGKLGHDYPPMEAERQAVLPVGPEWQYEPKWDGFRCVAFRDGEEIDLRSKNGQPLGRYFPEVVEALSKLKAPNFVLDGELVIEIEGKLSFDDLLQRIHPAASRVQKLSKETPATFIVFDILKDSDGEILVEKPLGDRRKMLEVFAKKYLARNESIVLSAITDDPAAAGEWLKDKRYFVDGIIAKRKDMPYQSANRKGMVKVKQLKTADCVVGGFRYGANSKQVGSLLLGLYDDEGELHHVGFTSALSNMDRKKLTHDLEGIEGGPSFTVNVPGAPSRWNRGRETEWVPLKPKLVIEVQYDHISNGRFRHGTKPIRWRPDKGPQQCTMEQIGL